MISALGSCDFGYGFGLTKNNTVSNKQFQKVQNYSGLMKQLRKCMTKKIWPIFHFSIGLNTVKTIDFTGITIKW